MMTITTVTSRRGVNSVLILKAGVKVYTGWVWIALALNSFMSTGILWRIRYAYIEILLATTLRKISRTLPRSLGDIRQQGLDRYSTVLKAIIEAAIVTWIATFSSAVLWSHQACNGGQGSCVLVRDILSDSASHLLISDIAGSLLLGITPAAWVTPRLRHF
jgi:hypothetical protein